MEVGDRVKVVDVSLLDRTSRLARVTGTVVLKGMESPGRAIYRVVIDERHRDQVQDVLPPGLMKTLGYEFFELRNRMPEEYPDDRRLSILMYEEELQPEEAPVSPVVG